MPTLDEAFPQVRDALLEPEVEPSPRIELLDPFTAMVAVTLEHQGVPRSRIAAAIGALDQAGLLSSRGLRAGGPLEIAEALREAGLPSPKSRLAVLVRLAIWIEAVYEGDADSLLEPPPSTEALRDELAALRGLGPSSVDAILLFALERPSYPVDRATYRVLARHGWLDTAASYDEARDTVIDHATDFADRTGLLTTDVLKDLSRGMEQLGRKYCRAAAPQCQGCPLEPLLPDGGPRAADG